MNKTKKVYQEHDGSQIQHEEIDSFFQDCAEKERLDMEDFLTNCDEAQDEYWAAEKKQAGKVVRNLKNTNVLIPTIPGTKKFRFSYFNYIVHRKDQFEKFIDCLAERGFMFSGWRNDTVVLNVLYNNIKYNVIDYFQEDYNVSLIADVACSLFSPEWLFSTYGQWNRSGELIGGKEELEFIRDRIENIFYGLTGSINITFSDAIKKINTVIKDKKWPDHNNPNKGLIDKCILQQIYTSDDPRYWEQP